MTKRKQFNPLSGDEIRFAVDAFYAALPGVYGVQEAIEEMLKKLHDNKIITRKA